MKHCDHPASGTRRPVLLQAHNKVFHKHLLTPCQRASFKKL